MLIYISINSASQALYASTYVQEVLYAGFAGAKNGGPTIYYFDISLTKFNIIKDKFNG